MATSREIERDQPVGKVADIAESSDRPTLSGVMPVFNEAVTFEPIVESVRRSAIWHELIIVDDGSDDGMGEILQRFVGGKSIQILRPAKNLGKSVALRLGFCQEHEEIVIIQDAGLEYDPIEY